MYTVRRISSLLYYSNEAYVSFEPCIVCVHIFLRYLNGSQKENIL